MRQSKEKILSIFIISIHHSFHIQQKVMGYFDKGPYYNVTHTLERGQGENLTAILGIVLS